MTVPLAVLAFFSTVIGFIETPRILGGLTLFSDLLSPVLGGRHAQTEAGTEALLLQLAATAASLAGLLIAFFRYFPRAGAEERPAASGPLEQFLLSGWGFDALYDRFIVRPLLGMTNLLRNEPIDGLYRAVALMNERASMLLKRTQNGSLRRYAAGIAAGAVLIIGLVLALAR
jgi:NADH-quinone oxidoreductase subunit L